MIGGTVEPSESPAPSAEFRAGAVFRRALKLYTRNVVPLFALGLLAVSPDALLLVTTPQTPAVLWVAWIALACGLNSLGAAVIVVATFALARAGRMDLRGSFARGGRQVGSVILTTLVVGLATGIGTLLLIVPGLIWMTMFAVAIPACVLEGRGVGNALTRSKELTKGYRWPLFGTLGVAMIVEMTVPQLLPLVFAGPHALLQRICVAMLFGALAMTFNTVLATLAYHDLRVAKEGGIADAA